MSTIVTTNPGVEQLIDAIYDSGLRHLPRGEQDIWEHMCESDVIDVDTPEGERTTGAQVLEWLANLAAQDPTAMTVSVTQSTRDGSERRTIGGRFTDDGEYVGGYALRGFELKVARRTSVFNPQMSEHPISLTEYRAIEVGYDVHPESVRIFGKVSLPEIGTGTVSEALTPLLDALVSVVEYLR